jgi:hypothetical protein
MKTDGLNAALSEEATDTLIYNLEAEVRRLEAENAKLREALDCFLATDLEKPTDRRSGRAA